VKLIRLLATLAMIVAGLAAPIPAAAAELKPGPTPDPEAMRGICAIFDGRYFEDERRSYTCELGEEEFLCTYEIVDDRVVQSCEYEVIPRLWPPPLKDRCEEANGTWHGDRFGTIAACEIKDSVLTVECPFDDRSDPELPILCDVGWIRSDQPMS